MRVVIDLREDGVYSRLSQLCEKYGMEYFHYPVDNQCGHIAEMVQLYPQLCQHIDAGNFYISCAMGLHRTDIALCVYWMFHVADQGVTPPPIRGYRKKDGHNTNKIMRVLNAMYDYMKEQNGAEPIPMEVFVSRKKIINEESKK